MLFRSQTMAEPENPVERQQQHYRLYGMILGLGEYDPKQLPVDERNDLLKKLSTMYATHPSRTIHSAVGWLLKRWDQYELIQSVDQNELPYDTTGVRDWFVIRVDPPKLDKQPHAESWDLSAPIFITMIVFPGGEIEIGQSGSQRKINLPGPFAVSDREITWQQFSPLDHDSHRLEGEKRFKRQLNGKRLTPDEPVFGVNWFEAVSYCRWLTECKMPGEINQSYLRKELLAENTKAPGWLEFPDNKDWDWGLDRSRPGFRLLTEAEWEYVARAGMVTQYSFGTSVELLADYGWYADNSGNRMSRTGLLRPSLVGLFDTHGNLYEWVDDW